MKYSRATTVGHSIARRFVASLEDINTLIAREGIVSGIPLFPQNEIVINMDRVEAYIAAGVPRDLGKSMDMCIGISNLDGSENEMLLVEFKLNVGPGLSSITKPSLVDKIVGSRNALGDEMEIHGKYIFIFPDTIIQQIRSRVSRLFVRLDGIPKPLDISEFQRIYF